MAILKAKEVRNMDKKTREEIYDIIKEVRKDLGLKKRSY